jgi:Sulfotransferase family
VAAGQIEAPVFIGGINRSGTTLMRRLLGSHSQIAIPPDELCYFRDDVDPRAPIAGREALERDLRELLATPKVRRWGLDEEEAVAEARRAEISHRGLYALLLELYRRRVGKPRVGEKTVGNEFKLDLLDSWFGGVRFVHVVRNPLDVWASSRYGARNEPSDWPAQPNRVLQWARLWNESAALGLHRSFTEPERYVLVRYEDLVARPAEVLERVCVVVGVQLEPERMLAMSDYEDKENSSFGDAARGTYNGFIRRSDDVDRRSAVTPDELGTLVSLCSERAYLLGYDLGDRPPGMHVPPRLAVRFAARRAAAKAQRLLTRS